LRGRRRDSQKTQNPKTPKPLGVENTAMCVYNKFLSQAAIFITYKR
jgi:hypothetical protein